jgi:AmmeMemoRadiSam system protein A
MAMLRLPDLAPADREALLLLARAAIHQRLGGPAVPPPARADVLAWHAGAFVTVRVQGELRGCVGIPDARQPLGEVVPHCAAAAAVEDPRFPAIRITELEAMRIEISVLSELAPVSDPACIEVGRHGLVVEQGRARGLLLPQVAPEHGWDREAFLRHTSTKAGLAPDAWRTGARVWSFEAVVFGEPAPVARELRSSLED